MLVSVVEEEAVEVAKLTKEEIEELAVEAVAVELVAPLVMVDKEDLLEVDLDLVQEVQVEQVLKLEEVEEVPVEIMLEKQLVDQVVQVDRHPVMLHLVQIVLLLEVQEEVMGLPFDEFRVMLLL